MSNSPSDALIKTLIHSSPSSSILNLPLELQKHLPGLKPRPWFSPLTYTSETSLYSLSLSFHVSPALTFIPNSQPTPPPGCHTDTSNTRCSKPISPFFCTLCWLTMIHWVTQDENVDISLSQLLWLRVSTTTYKQILSPLLPKCLWNLALPFKAPVLPAKPSTAAILSSHGLSTSIHPLQPVFPRIAQPLFQNFRNAHVLPLLL